MTKRRFSTGFATVLLGLAIFGLVPSEAKAIQVMCSDAYGQCEVQDNPSFISCTCNNESSTGGTGGDEYQGLTEAELLAICAAELAFCTPGMDTGLDSGTSTFGDTATSDSGTSDSGTSDSGSSSSSDTGESTSDSGTSTSGEEGTTAADSSTSGGGDSGTSGGETSGTTSDSGSESGTDGGGGLTSAEAGDELGGTGTGDEGAAIDEGKGCSVTDESGFGALALFGMFGLLGLRSRKHAA